MCGAASQGGEGGQRATGFCGGQWTRFWRCAFCGSGPALGRSLQPGDPPRPQEPQAPRWEQPHKQPAPCPAVWTMFGNVHDEWAGSCPSGAPVSLTHTYHISALPWRQPSRESRRVGKLLMMLRMMPINDECTRVCRCRERRAFLSELLSEFVVRSGWDGLERGAGASFSQLEIPSIESCTAQ